MCVKGEAAARISQITGLKVEASVGNEENPITLLGVVKSREQPFASEQANTPYRDNVILGNVTRTEDGVTDTPSQGFSVNVEDLTLKI